MIANANRLFIDGKWTRASKEAWIDVITPSTGKLYMRVVDAHESDINQAVGAARRAFDSGPWPRLSHAERARYLTAMGDLVIARTADFADTWSNEVGALRSFGGFAVPAAAGIFHYYASLAASFAFEERHALQAAEHAPQVAGSTGLLVREPVGVVAAITPWNAPLLIAIVKIAPALLAGCTVILKASPEAPGSAYLLAEIAETVGLPPGVLNVVTAGRPVSELLVRHLDVDKVTFTGSTAAGKRIASICGERVARCTLELGGKSAAVVLDDYDVNAVVEALAAPSLMMAGQVCAALTRIIVPRRSHDALVEALASAFSATRVGDPFDRATQMGPLATRVQRDRVETYIAKGIAEGAALVTGGGRPPDLDDGFYVQPTLFGQVHNSMIIAREEIFGPVISVIPVDSDEQAIKVANDSPFGLNASIFTNDVERAYRMARQLRSGTVGHNAFRADFTIGFGGFKQSGIGREGGREGLMPFLEAKTVILNGVPAHVAAGLH